AIALLAKNCYKDLREESDDDLNAVNALFQRLKTPFWELDRNFSALTAVSSSKMKLYATVALRTTRFAE
ncbi:unnamed protein product, partial [Ilex paraguariensis]